MVFPSLRMYLAAGAASLLVLASCGAGVIGAVVASDSGSGSSPPAQPPALSLPVPTAPLVRGGVSDFRQVVISNLELPASDPQIELRALGVTSIQPSLILSGQGKTTVLGFFLQTSEITAAIEVAGGQFTDMDIQADLAVLVDGAEVAPPVSFTLLRQPKATLVPEPGSSEVFLSVLGGTRLVLRVSSLRAADSDELEMLVVTPDPADPDPNAVVARQCTNLAMDPIPGSDDFLVSGDVPGNAFPAQVVALVRDAVAGPSTPVVEGVLYTPEVGVASPSAGPTDGGTLVTLTGQAMVPLDFDVPGPAEPDFDLVTILIRKGGRDLVLPPSDLRRAQSSLNQLVFPMPPSPDGRPGPVEVVLQVRLSGLVRETKGTEGTFVYGHRSPTFGPRGAVLNESPLALELASVEDPSGGPDVVLLTEVAGLPMVQLYASEENGMFTRFGLPLQAAETGESSQHDPVDLGAGDFNLDSLDDVVVINRGIGTVATHTLVLGRAAPAPPLRAFGPSILGTPRARSSALGDLNLDGIKDVVILPGSDAPVGTPEVFLSRIVVGAPAFVLAGTPPVGTGPFDAMELADLDGDGILDMVLGVGGAQPRIVSAYGFGDGQFGAVQSIDLTSVPGYTPDARSAVVGVHACGGTPASVAVVFSGVPGSGVSEPTVAVLAPSGPRAHAPPVAAGVLGLLGADTALGHSHAADLDADGVSELVVSASGESTEPLRLLSWQGEGFAQVPAGVDRGVERPYGISSLEVGVAAPGTVPRLALLATHTVRIDGFEERRLSSWLVAPGPRLLAADGSREVDAPIEGLATGNFSQSTVPSHRDLAMATTVGAAMGEVRILANDGLGVMQEQSRVDVPRILPRTLSAGTLPVPAGVAPDSTTLIGLGSDGWLQVLVPVPQDPHPQLVSIDLDPVVPPHLQGRPFSDASRVKVGDVDGDGYDDLVLLVRFDGLPDPAEGDGLLLLVRGRTPSAPGDAPVFSPRVGTAVHGNASSLALGDFVREPAGSPTRLEVAVAVPRGDAVDPLSGNHVRFFRHQAGTVPEEDHFVSSFTRSDTRVLLAGSEPRQVRAADVDGNGVADLLVSSGGDSRLRIFLNGGVPVPGLEEEVNIGAFHEAFATPRYLPPGEPDQMLLRDLNGDAALDVVVVTRQRGSALEHSVAYYLSSGLGDVDGPFLIPMDRTGNRVPASGSTLPRDAEMILSMDDFNADGRVDLVLGWKTSGPGDRNLRMLFGGAR